MAVGSLALRCLVFCSARWASALVPSQPFIRHFSEPSQWSAPQRWQDHSVQNWPKVLGRGLRGR
eukprot:1515455-Alexandrium_andersonii.AAC.1